MKLDIKLLYLSLHCLLKNKYGVGNTISRKEFYGELGRHFLIPKNLRSVVMAELREMNLIKIKDRDNIILLDYDLDIKEDAHKFLNNVFL